jgi:hypothetical protein
LSAEARTQLVKSMTACDGTTGGAAAASTGARGSTGVLAAAARLTVIGASGSVDPSLVCAAAVEDSAMLANAIATDVAAGR